MTAGPSDDGSRALGLRIKLGWAVAVTVDAAPDDPSLPVVVARSDVHVRREGVFAFHAALDAEASERPAVVASSMDRAADAATDALMEALDEHDPAIMGVVVGRGVRHIPIDRILESAQLLHSAEAEVLQVGFVEAARRLDVACVRVPFATAEADDAWPVISGLARSAGRPWQKDHKLAATAAWIARRRIASPA